MSKAQGKFDFSVHHPFNNRVIVHGQKKIGKYCAFRGTAAFYRGSTLQ